MSKSSVLLILHTEKLRTEKLKFPKLKSQVFTGLERRWGCFQVEIKALHLALFQVPFNFFSFFFFWSSKGANPLTHVAK